MTAKLASNKRLAGLDTLRALAIVAVMGFHLRNFLPESWSPVTTFGWAGVDLFFVLSGYLIGAQLLKPLRAGRKLSFGAFYRNRAYRILPVYLVVLALYLLWPAWREERSLSPLWQFLTFTENLFVDYSRNEAFSHVWSLCVEEHFYLLLPVVVLLLSRRPALWKTVAVLSSLVAFGVAIRSFELCHVLRPLGAGNDGYGVTYIERIYYPTYARLDGLIAGVALALVRTYRPTWWAALLARANWLLAGGTALTGLALWMFADRFDSATGVAAAGTIVGFPILALGLAMWVAAAAEPRCWFGRMQIPGARTVSMLAYSLYLTHKEVAHLDASYLPRWTAGRDWHTIVFVVPTCMAVAGLLYVTVERPFLRLRDRRMGRSTHLVDVEARAEPAL
ncbi:MAG: acyltransferase [Acidobacteriaceae bacterium]